MSIKSFVYWTKSKSEAGELALVSRFEQLAESFIFKDCLVSRKGKSG